MCFNINHHCIVHSRFSEVWYQDFPLLYKSNNHKSTESIQLHLYVTARKEVLLITGQSSKLICFNVTFMNGTCGYKWMKLYMAIYENASHIKKYKIHIITSPARRHLFRCAITFNIMSSFVKVLTVNAFLLPGSKIENL